jgi:hypothetical protein
MHLATAGLAGGEVDDVAQALEHAHNSLACCWEQGVVVAGDEKRDAQEGSLTGRNFNTDSISHSCTGFGRMFSTFHTSAREATEMEILWDRIRLLD